MSITTCATLQPTTTSYLWPDYLPTRRITLLAADPAAGKTALCLHLAAKLSKGLTPSTHQPPIPQDSPLKTQDPIDTLLLSPEDNPTDTLLPRLLAEGADLARIHLLPLPPQNANLVDYLREAILALPGVKLLIIDPITSLLPMHASTRDLLPLAQLAADFDLALLLTTRLPRALPTNPAHLPRILGTSPLASLARTIHLLLPTTHSTCRMSDTAFPSPQDSPLKTQDSPSHTLLPIKSTTTRLPPPLPFSLTSILTWSTAPALPLTSLMPASPTLQSAIDFLTTTLTGGPIEARHIRTRAHNISLSDRTLERAKAHLAVESLRTSLEHPWFWRLPNDPTRLPTDPPPATLAILRSFGDLAKSAPKPPPRHLHADALIIRNGDFDAFRHKCDCDFAAALKFALKSLGIHDPDRSPTSIHPQGQLPADLYRLTDQHTYDCTDPYRHRKPRKKEKAPRKQNPQCAMLREGPLSMFVRIMPQPMNRVPAQ